MSSSADSLMSGPKPRQGDPWLAIPRTTLTAVMIANFVIQTSMMKAAARSHSPAIASRPGANGCSAAAKSAIVRYRRSRLRSSARSTIRSSSTGSSGRTDRIGGAGSETIRASVAAASFPWNGARPVNTK